MIIIQKILIVLFFVIFGLNVKAENIKIKLAIIDNLKFEKLSTDKYANDYMDGILTAIDLAKSKDIEVELKTFFYDREPLAILKKIPEVKSWNPDLIIGPRSSSLFLLLKDHFSSVLVLSPIATANEVSALPDNFYSVTLPNKYVTSAVVNIIKNRFAKKHVTPIIEIDCKNCLDFYNDFERVAFDQKISVRSPTYFLNKNAETVSINDLLKNYKKGDIILIPNTSYTSGTLAGRISDHLKDNKLVFIGGDGWGDWSASYVGKVSSAYDYSALRISPWSLEIQSDKLKSFSDNFKKFRGILPTGVASYMSYTTLLAALEPHFLMSSKKSKSKSYFIDKKLILSEFKEQLSKDKYYARPTQYAIYKVKQSGEKFDGKVSALGEKNER